MKLSKYEKFLIAVLIIVVVCGMAAAFAKYNSQHTITRANEQRNCSSIGGLVKIL